MKTEILKINKSYTYKINIYSFFFRKKLYSGEFDYGFVREILAHTQNNNSFIKEIYFKPFSIKIDSIRFILILIIIPIININ